jgi:MFS transporter, CP family, cyanate transporter
VFNFVEKECVCVQKRTYYWLAAGILFIAANLRLPITMMPPLVPWLKNNLGLSTSMSGLLTTIPLIVFALLSPTIANLGIKKGNAQVLLGTLVTLVVGCYLRILPNKWFLLGATLIVGVGISGGNVLLPAVIQEYFPYKTIILTSLYTFMMGFIASIGTGTSAPLAQHIGLAGAMAVISLFGVAALLIWAIAVHQLPHKQAKQQVTPHNHGNSQLLKIPLTWMIIFFFGAQSLLYYSMLTWLPVYWTNTGFSTTISGLLATIFQLCGMPLSLLTPIIARKRSGMYFISCLMGGGFGLGAILLLVCQHNFVWNVLIAILLGVAAGASFSMCVVFFQRRTSSVIETAQISGIAQSVGYLLAACGPVFSGMINSWTHSWVPVMLIYAVIAVVMGFDGIMITNHPPLNTQKDKIV